MDQERDRSAPPPAKPLGPGAGIEGEMHLSKEWAGDLDLARLDHREASPLRFTGTGGEYFRIWIVNTLLILLTLGIYSAWAKRRKARWFARHTLLAGDAFDYHGSPWRILAGRILALGLLIAYGHAFAWSPAAGWTMLAALYACGPALFAGAQRFRLSNTSWRGVRFGFEANALTTYASCLPVLAGWTFGTAAAALRLPIAVLIASIVGVGLLFPLAHAWLKRFQHHHATFGDRRFSFELPAIEFYALYLRMILLMGAVAVIVTVANGLMNVGVSRVLFKVSPPQIVATLATLGLVWLLLWPVYAAQLQRIVWSHSRLEGDITFRYELRGRSLLKVAAGQSLLVLMSLGLYWPYAAVRIARMRIEAMTVVSRVPIEHLPAVAMARPRSGAAGDGAADAFGLDLGW